LLTIGTEAKFYRQKRKKKKKKRAINYK